MPVQYDPRLFAVRANPYPFFRLLQEEDPLHRSEVLNGWLLTRYADVKAAFSHEHLSSNTLSPLFERMAPPKRAAMQDLVQALSLWAIFNDAPKHTRLRGLMNKAFTPRAISALRPLIQRIVHSLLDHVEERARGFAKISIDLVRDFATPLPLQIILSMLGVQTDEIYLAKAWSDELALVVGGSLHSPNKYERAQQAYQKLNELFRSALWARRAQPLENRSDILSGLLSAQEREDVLSQDEILASCVMLLFGGHETTVNLISNGMLTLLRHPEQLAKLRAEPALIESAVEELMRYDGPAGALSRIAQKDLTWHGQHIAAGERIFLQINAANRDPRIFAEPDVLNLERTPNPHLGFGFASHYCVGAALARAEAQIALSTFIERYSHIELVPCELDWHDLLALRGPLALPLDLRVM